uniref:Uncharacterized protein n=1 Tax=Ciona intestinalis TaxID=7719 RepID=H2Y329_CIOIN
MPNFITENKNKPWIEKAYTIGNVTACKKLPRGDCCTVRIKSVALKNDKILRTTELRLY